MESVMFVFGGLPQRYMISFLCVVGYCLFFIMRQLPAYTRSNMVKRPYEIGNESTECEGKGHRYERTNETLNNEFDWDRYTQICMNSIFYYGYGLTQIPGGIIADKYGAKHVMATSVLTSIICTFLFPILVSKTNVNFVLAVRFLNGFITGGFLPALASLLARWVTPDERSLLGGLIFASFFGANSLGQICIMQLMEYDWSTSYYTFGGISLFWYIIWNVWVYNDPGSHPFITEKELNYLQKNIVGVYDRKKRQLLPPMKKILKSLPVISLIICQFGQMWCILTFEHDIFQYLLEVIKFPRAQLVYVNLPQSLGAWIVAFLGGWAGNRWYRQKSMDQTDIRKFFTGLATFIPALSFILASFEGCHRYTVAVVFSVGSSLLGCYFAGGNVSPLDMSPNYAGTVMALLNSSSVACVIVHPMIINALITYNTLQEWRKVFWICFYIVCGTFLVYLSYGSSELQEWNDSDDEVQEEKENR